MTQRLAPVSYSDRAMKIVDRLLPMSRRTPHGFYERDAFYDRAVVKYWRKRLHLYLKAIITAKSEGHPPRIGVPKNSEHIFRPGDALVDVSAYIEAQLERTNA